jgi:hypothetical protein
MYGCLSRIERAGRIVRCVPLIVFCLAAQAFPWFFSGAVTRGVARADTVAYVPSISNVEGGKIDWEKGGEMQLCGSFFLLNERRTPFILRVLFGNGGALRNVRGGDSPAGIPLERLALRYRDANGQMMEKVLANTEYRDGGYIYEVLFLEEDMQSLYEMEMWGAIKTDGIAVAGGGSYEEIVRFEIEKL